MIHVPPLEDQRTGLERMSNLRRTTGSALRRAGRAAVLGALLLALLAPIGLSAASAAPARVNSAHVVIPLYKGAYLGLFRPPVPIGFSELSAYSRSVHKSPAIVMWYQPWITTGYGQFKTDEIKSLLRLGVIPLITWEPWDPGANVGNLANQPAYKLQAIIDGKWDGYIRRWAQGAKAVHGPVMIRPFHEMNGYWYPWSGFTNSNTPALFRKAWIRVWTIFKNEGATNVTWVWSVNWASSPNTYENRWAVYYPGAAYVNWTAISGFNWGTSRPGSRNMSFEDIYSKPLAYLRTLKKPIMIAEMACTTQGVNKPSWIATTYHRIRFHHPEIKAVVYYDHNETNSLGTQYWRIASTSASLWAFRDAINNSWFASSWGGSLLATGTP